MSTEQTAYPLSWPVGTPRTKLPGPSRFGSWNRKPTVAEARKALNLELGRLGALRVVVSTNIQLRKDGQPYSDRREPPDAGVAVYFTLKALRCVLACDRWNTVGENLWAVAKHIEALRGQERWGVGSVEQAFSGYAALPEYTQAESCWQILGVPERSTRDVIRKAWVRLCRDFHPDTGGDAQQMARINAARDEADALSLA